MCFSSCKKKSKAKKERIPKKAVNIDTRYNSKNHLIECEDLKVLNTDSNVKLIDFRRPAAFFKEHIPNAINIWRTDIEDSSFPYEGIMASKNQIENLFSSLGIKTKDELIIYDDSGACNALRLWWVLKNYGFDHVKILNGGFTQWKSIKGAVTTDVTVYSPSHFKFLNNTNTSLYASLEEMKSVTNSSSNSVILDTRTVNEFSGKRQKKGASRAGHIPNSILIDWVHAIDYNGNKKFKPYKELLELYKQHGITKEKAIYVYCHSGVRSAHTTFVLTELLGFKNVKNYDGSWVEWSYYKDLPIEEDRLTTIFK
ncbi:sulfurtransferase [Flavivirga jejuensis]